MNSTNFPIEGYHAAFIKNINQEIYSNKCSPFIKNFRENYDGNVPLYALAEIMSFGTQSKFYKNLATADKKEIAKTYDINFKFLESWMKCISYVQNLFAH